MGQTDKYLSTLARRLWPYISTYVRQMIGDNSVSGTAGGDITWIQGTAIPEEDALGTRGTNSIDFQISRDADTEIASGTESAILWGNANKASATRSAAAGFGAYADNTYQFAIGESYRDTPHGDAQGSRFFGMDIITVDNTWQTFASFEIRTDTTWSFMALLVGIEAGAANSYAYQILGAVENDGGTTSVLGQTVTTIYEDDANFNARAVADDANDEIEFQVTDTGNNGRDSKWSVHMITAEATEDA